jgi:hypothetical protein
MGGIFVDFALRRAAVCNKLDHGSGPGVKQAPAVATDSRPASTNQGDLRQTTK